jgi:hypothetical protein
VEPISARSIIDAASTGDGKRKDERRERLSSAALAVADRKAQSAYSPIVIAGVLRLIDFVLISFIGLALYFGYGTAAVGDWWRYPILALSIAAGTVVVLQVLDIYQVQHLQAGFPRIPRLLRDIRVASYRRNTSAGSSNSLRQRLRIAASSTAIAPPAPMKGRIGWQASPRRTKRPPLQQSLRGRS